MEVAVVGEVMGGELGVVGMVGVVGGVVAVVVVADVEVCLYVFLLLTAVLVL